MAARYDMKTLVRLTHEAGVTVTYRQHPKKRGCTVVDLFTADRQRHSTFEFTGNKRGPHMTYQTVSKAFQEIGLPQPVPSAHRDARTKTGNWRPTAIYAC